MKKQFAALLVLLFVFTAAWASGETVDHPDWITYEVKDLDMTIQFPEDFLVLQKDMPADHPILVQANITPKEINKLLEEDILEAELYEGSGSLGFTTQKVSYKELETLKDEEFYRQQSQLLAEKFESAGLELVNQVVDRNENGLYNITEVKIPSEEQEIYRFIYSTIQNSFTVMAIGNLGAEEYNAGYREVMYGILDSIRFGTVIGDSSSAVTYYDPVGGVTFLWPAGYIRPYYPVDDVEGMLTQEAFVKGLTGDRAVLQYQCMDLTVKAPNENYSGCDSDAMTVKEFASLTGKSALLFEEAQFGNHKFFKQSKGDSVYLYAIKGPTMYYFQFSHPSENELYQDFIRVMESVTYDSDKK